MLLTNPEVCMLYLDIRTAPGQDGGAIRHELRALMDECGLEGKVEQFVNRNGYEAHGIEPLAGAVDEAHRSVFGEECEIADSPECSMWRDHNVYNEMGIPALTYGPPGRAGTGAYAVTRGGPAERGARLRADRARALRVDPRDGAAEQDGGQLGAELRGDVQPAARADLLRQRCAGGIARRRVET